MLQQSRVPVDRLFRAFSDRTRLRILRLLQDGERHVVTPKGKTVDVRAAVHTVHMSAHADRQQLLEYMSALPKPKRVFLVHGEEGKIENFSAFLKKRKIDVDVPTNGTRVIV